MSDEQATATMNARRQLAFSETSNPEAYVPREATDAVLASLATWASGDQKGSTVSALVGPPGIGKTFLLRVFESRMRKIQHPPNTTSHAQTCDEDQAPRTLYLPYAGLLPVEFVSWVKGLLGRSQPSNTDPASGISEFAALLELSKESASPFFLLIDDADSMPPETLRAFVRELPSERSTLRVLMAMNDDARASRLLAGFDSLEPHITRLRTPMDEAETEAYLTARVRWAEISEAELPRLDAEMKRQIHVRSAGVPQSVQRLAAALLEDEDANLRSDLEAKRKREDWMGRPFDEDPFETDS